MRRVWILQHHAVERPGRLGPALRAGGVASRVFRLYKDPRLPRDVGGADGLIVLGGPMGVNDGHRYPFLRDELRLIERALARDLPVLGICLGSQLLAAALGARVSPGRRKEIGWKPVALTEAGACDPLFRGVVSPFTAFHWHGDVFSLPRGAVRLAASDLTVCQAFRYGRNAWGLLFHLEATASLVAGMIAAFPGELRAAGLRGEALLREAAVHLPSLRRIGREVFRRWTGCRPARRRRACCQPGPETV